MKETLIYISLCGIQEYISQSRKTSDLKISSDIVKNMMPKLRQYLKKYAANKGNMSVESLFADELTSADFLLAIMFDNRDKALSVKELEEEIQDTLKTCANKEKNFFPEEIGCFVAAAEMLNGKNSYENAYSEVSDRLFAYKNDRLGGVHFGNWMKPEAVGTGNKLCTVCNKRPGVIDINKEKGEWLCTECNEKRVNFKDNAEFPSTQDIAEIDMDIHRTRLYYALVQMDLDNLGIYMSGEKGRREGEDLLSYQTDLARDIRNFSDAAAKSVESIVPSDKKLVVYNGGDDLLFFCPLHKVWEVIKKVEEDLHDALGDRRITCSKSIVIAHYKEPLRHVVKTSRRQLQAVKNRYEEEGKDGLSLTLLYNGNTSRNICLRDERIYEIGKKIVDVFSGQSLTRSVIFTLEKELLPFGQYMDYEEFPKLGEIINSEIGRITARKSKQGQEEEMKTLMLSAFHLFLHQGVGGMKVELESYFDMLCIFDKWAQCCRGYMREGR